MDAKNPSGAFGRSTFVAYSALALSIGALVVGFIACWSLQSMVGRAAIPLGDPFFAWLGMALLMAGLFPLSAIAFTWMEVPGIVEQAKNDCKMLGADGKWNRYADPTASRYNPSNYALHYSLAIIATLMGVGLFFRDPDKHLSINTIQALRLGFLGAYLYCVGLIYRRYTTLDLQPSVYLRCAAGLISGLAFNYVAFTTFDNVSLLHTGDNAIDTQQRFTGTAAAVTAIVAFSLGYFPNLAIGWFTRISHTALQQDVRRSDALPLSLIDGISELHEARLRDQGIDNIQNLATATIRDLVLKTPFDAQEIVEWIDQAVLLL